MSEPIKDGSIIPSPIESLPITTVEKVTGIVLDFASNAYIDYVGFMASKSGQLAGKLSEIFPKLGTEEEVKNKLIENGRKNIEGGAAGVATTLDRVADPLVRILATKEPKAAGMLRAIINQTKERIEPTKNAVLEKLKPQSE